MDQSVRATSDEGTDTDSAQMNYMCQMYRIKKIVTPAYSPHANPVERYHRTLNHGLRTWTRAKRYKDWDEGLPMIVHEYNQSIHTTTNCAPQQLFMGRRVRNPYIPIIPDDHPALERYEYLQRVRDAQEICLEYGREATKRTRERQNKGKDTKDRKEFRIGQKVGIRNHAPEHKLKEKYDGPYIIVDVYPNALHCIWWDIKQRANYRLHHHAQDFGTVEKKIVHPKDVKPWPDHLPDKYWWAKELAKALMEKPHKVMSDTASTVPETRSSASGHTSQGSNGHRRRQRSESDVTTQSSATTQNSVISSIVDVESIQPQDSEGNNTGGRSQSDVSSCSSVGRDLRTPAEQKLDTSCKMRRWQTKDSINRETDSTPASQTLRGDPRRLPDTSAGGVAQWLGGQRTPEQRTDWTRRESPTTQIPAEHSTPKVVLERVEAYTPRRGTRRRHEPLRFGEQVEEEQLGEIDKIPESATRRVTWNPGGPTLHSY